VGDTLRCAGLDCRRVFPITGGIPLLVDPRSSLFSFEEYLRNSAKIVDVGPSRWRGLRALIPPSSLNFKAKENLERFGKELLLQSEEPLVLVIGGGTTGEGLTSITNNPSFTCIETDLALGPRTRIICDAHRLPFPDGSMDGVVIQAVLEHVVDPQRCVEEIYRVLGNRGIVYCETPFIQQVHLGAYDFTRFTHVGLRLLFRRFEEVGSGVACGPGMALAWSCQYFLQSFTRSPSVARVLRVISRLFTFWLTYFDPLVGDSPGALDAASAYYFFGRKSSQRLSDREIIAQYRGLQRSMR